MFRTKFFASLIFTLASAVAAHAQTAPAPTPAPNADKKQAVAAPEKFDLKNLNAEQLAETVIFNYSSLRGRETLAQIRKTELESGAVTRFVDNAPPQNSTYQKRIVRGESQEKDRVRLDQKLSQAEYALIYDTTKTFGLINDSVFVPREEADNNFKAAIFHGMDALLRYKENGSTLKLAGRDKQLGVDFYKLDVTDKQNRTTRFNISSKLFRVLSLEYQMATTANAAPTKFARKFYDYRPAQGTLVAYRSVLYAGDKQIEETNIATVTFGSKIEDGQFVANR